MPTQGPKICGTGADGGGHGESWSNPQNIIANDGQVATSQMVGALDTTNPLDATNFGFTIPGSATILGVQVDVNCRATGGSCNDIECVLLVGGSADKSSAVNWPGALANRTYGSSSDLWGLTSAAILAVVNTSGFGFEMSASEVAGNPLAAVDFIQITVTFSVPATKSDYFLGGRHSESRIILPGRGIG